MIQTQGNLVSHSYGAGVPAESLTERQQDLKISADNEIDDSDDEGDPGLTKRKDRSIEQNIPIPSTSSTIDIPPLPPVLSTSTSEPAAILPISESVPVASVATLPTTVADTSIPVDIPIAPANGLPVTPAPATNGNQDITMG